MKGALIGITAARRAAEQAALVTSLGGVPVIASAIRPDAPRGDDELVAELERVLAEPVDTFVFLTGVGAGILFDAARRHGLEARWRAMIDAATVVGRGTKPRRALRRWGVEVDQVVDPPVTSAVSDALREQAVGRRIVVQSFGPSPDELVATLEDRGATVVVVTPYESAMPDDAAPVVELARRTAGGELAAVTFTSMQAARQFVAIADDGGIGVEDLDRSPCLIVAVGPVTRQALEDDGLTVDLEPETPRMGAMYQALAARLRMNP